MTDDQELSPLKRAFLAIEDLEQRLAAAEAGSSAPIAVVGMGTRLPGGVESPDDLWDLLAEGRDAIVDIPSDRWDIDEFYDPDPTAPGKMSTRQGGFLDDVSSFDPQFFGIAPKEADAMDPQQRLLLEVAWEALEHGAIPPRGLAGSSTGVFVGVTTGDYAQLTLNTQGIDGLGAYYASGIAHSVVSGRLSYLLGLTGPSVTLDTACSSSLVAVHLAVQSLRSGESDLALAGGVNLMLSPEMSVTLSKYQMMAPDCRCKFGDARADGFVRAEGAAMIALRRLDDAVARGDRILGVVRGSAVGQDGASSGLTAPNGPSQVSVIRDALADARLGADAIGYIEAHGTGTSLGDPIEVQALGDVFGADRTGPLPVGSIKTNLGHLEAAAGITGLIKLVLMVERGEIPASLHFATPSPHIDWDDVGVEVPTAHRPWTDSHRAAGVSSFGFSGTNAHIIVEQAPASEEASADGNGRHVPIVVSAATASALDSVIERVSSRLENAPLDLAGVARTLSSGRSHFHHRLGFAAGSLEEAASTLREIGTGRDVAGATRLSIERVDPPRIAFMFTGQGSQYPGMAADLYEAEPVFRAAIDECATILQEREGLALRELMFDGSADGLDLHQTAATQPALVALQYGLSRQWRHWGIEPDVVLGHSVGEFSAAIAAGAVSLEDGLVLIAARGRLMQALPAGGAMAAVFADPDEVERAVAASTDVSIAAINGPRHVVVSGAEASVDQLVASFAETGSRTSKLVVSHAFHSSLVDPMLDDLEAAAATCRFSEPQTRLISNVTGALVREELTQPAYWRDHARSPVAFAAGIGTALELGVDVFVELGPHPTLVGMGQTIPGAETAAWIGSLHRDRAAHPELLGALASAFAAGVDPDWDTVVDRGATPASMPTYPFERERHWLPPAKATIGVSEGGHPLLGNRLPSPLATSQFAQVLSPESVAVLGDHRVFGRPILPATGFLETALAAAQLTGTGSALADVDLLAALVVDDGSTRTMSTTVEPNDSAARFTIASQPAEGDKWDTHATGRIVAVTPTARTVDLAECRARMSRSIEGEEHRSMLGDRGLDFGTSLHGVESMQVGDGEALAMVRATGSLGAYCNDPAQLDACLQTLGWIGGDPDETYLPISIGAISVHAPLPPEVLAHAILDPVGSGGEILGASVSILDTNGVVLAEILDIRLRRVDASALAPRGNWAEWLYDIEWTATADIDRDPLPVAAARAAAEAATAAAAAAVELPRYQVLRDELEHISGYLVVDALAALGAPVDGSPFDPGQLPVVDNHRRLVERLIIGLVEDDVLRVVADGVTIDPTHVGRSVDWQGIEAQYPDADGEIAITRRCGEGLAEVWAGQADPIELLFPGGGSADAEKMYRDSPFARFYNKLAADAVVEIANATEGPLRILEIGAGTGGTTAGLLPLLPADRTSYQFTDISPLFVERACERFASFSFLAGSVLDIDADPADQGLDLGSFDIVIATNVLHATPNLRRTFDHVGRLLRQGGALVMMEMTKPERFIDITFGLTPGWWLFDDTDVRPDYLLLDRPRWEGFLTDVGFDSVCSTPPVGSDDVDYTLQTLVLATAPGTSGPSAGSWLVVGGEDGLGADLADRLNGTDGCEAVLIAPEQIDEVGFEDRVWAGVVHVANTDRSTAHERNLGSLVTVAQRLAVAGRPLPLILASRGAVAVNGRRPDADQATSWGFMRALALEHPELSPRSVDLDPGFGEDPVDTLLVELGTDTGDDQIAWRNGVRYLSRLRRRPDIARGSDDARTRRIVLPDSGVLDHISLEPVVVEAPGPGEVAIDVRAAGMNFRDVMNALAMRDDQDPAGSECAGVVAALGTGVEGLAVGTPVLAVVGGCFGDRVNADARLVVPMPAGLSFTEAATLPLAFLTANDALHRQGGLQAGADVLVHAASGGVGLAAVQLAQAAGARVFGTAGSDHKRALALRAGATEVGDSRDPEFGREFGDERPFDLIVNSLTGPFLEASARLLRPGGTFVELGKQEAISDSEMAAWAPDTSYRTVPLATEIYDAPSDVGAVLQKLVAMVDAGELSPLPHHVFSMDDAAQAFRYMSTARHVGKVVLTNDDQMASGREVPATGTVVVSGGLSGIGLATASWLAERGAQSLLLFGRSAPTPEAELVLDDIRSSGVMVHVASVDVADADAVSDALDVVRRDAGPITGLIHSAGVLSDGALAGQDWASFDRVLAPKVAGTRNLLSATADDPIELCVLYSSAASLFGSAGQANHAAANRYLDAIAQARQAEGAAALSICWGGWADIGSVVAYDVEDRMRTQGLSTMDPDHALEAMHAAITAGTARLGVVPIDWPAFLSALPGSTSRRWLSSVATRPRETSKPGPVGSIETLADRVGEQTGDDRIAAVVDFVSESVARVLGSNSGSSLSERQPLSEMGLDSLMAVELRNRLAAGVGPDATLPAVLVFDYPTIEALTHYFIDEHLGADETETTAAISAAGSAPATGDTDLDALLASVETLDDADIDAMLTAPADHGDRNPEQ